MRFIRLMAVIFLSFVFPANSAFGQTTEIKEKEAAVQTQKSLPDQEVKPGSKKPAISHKSTPQPSHGKKSDVPEVPLTNARIVFDHTAFDFGNVPPGSQITHHFPVRNEGTDTLVITRIKAG